MGYTQTFFNPLAAGGTAVEPGSESISFRWTPPASTAEDVYVFSPDVILAINVALAAGRPLLIAGEPGSGKTRLANAVAKVQQWEFYPKTVTSRTQAADLLWTFDALRRLNDATTPGTQPAALSPQRYVEPGVVWWG